ncbi:MAG: hypothetical protein RL220_1023 [Bacteroidota bacterium]
MKSILPSWAACCARLSLVLMFLFSVSFTYATDDCQGRTQTPGGWGAPAKGNNPGAYRDANFAEAFPNGIVLGCGNNTVTFTTAYAVEVFLPCGGPSNTISGSYMNPSCFSNNLVNHLLAATLSVGFDANDPDFGQSSTSLGDMTINNGTFNGWTVSEVLALANQVLGGCSTQYTANQMKNVLAMINENFVDGTGDNGNLDCDEDPCVNDTEDPYVINGVSDLVVECGDDYSAGMPTFGDNLDTNLSVEYSQTEQGNECSYTIIRVWVVTDDCENSLTYVQTITISDTEAPYFTNVPSDVTVECGDEIPASSAWAADACDDMVTVTSSDEMVFNGCTYDIVRTFTATDNCGHSATATQNIYVEDTTAPVLSEEPADLILSCDAEVPAAAEVTAYDECDGIVEVLFEETEGESSEGGEGILLDCELLTPADALTDPTWSLILFNFPGGTHYCTTQSGHLTVFADMSAHIEATLVCLNNPNGGWHLSLDLADGADWPTWDNMPFPTSYKDDFNLAGDDYLDWWYFIIQNSSSLTGWGDYEGSSLTLNHLPASYYYGYQLGVAANNVNGNYGNGGWITATGNFVDSSTGTSASVSSSGDLAFDQSCCNRPQVVRTWTAVDCSGNVTTHTQTISFAENVGFKSAQKVDVSEGLFIKSAYPNPTSDMLYVVFEAGQDAMTTLQLMNPVSGLVENIYTGSVNKGEQRYIEIDTNSLAAGVYNLVLTGNNGEQVSRTIIVQ